MKKRILVIVLASCLALFTFASCGAEKQPPDTGIDGGFTPGTSAVVDAPEIEEPDNNDSSNNGSESNEPGNAETESNEGTPDMVYSEGLSFESNGDGTCYVTGTGSCPDRDIIIPPTSPAGDVVTGIGSNAFAVSGYIISIIIPDTVTTVQPGAFHWESEMNFNEDDYAYYIGSYTNPYAVLIKMKDTEITHFEMYDTTVVINDGAFSECGKLVNLSIPDSVKCIGYGAFENCESLVSATLPEGLTAIAERTFYDCDKLKSINIPDSVISIGDEAFEFCVSLYSINIPSKVESIGKDAFKGCQALIEVYNQSSLGIGAGSSGNGYVGETAKNVYTDENGASRIAEKDGYVFYCNDEAGEYYLLDYPKGSTSLTLPENINGNSYGIYACTFYNCNEITEIVISNGVNDIGGNAFEGCLNVMQNEGGVWYVDNWAVSSDDSVTSVSLKSGTVGIAVGTFSECASLGSVSCGESLKYIGDGAFANCVSLSSIVIPEGVRRIGMATFMNCSSLTTATIPKSVETIEDYAFGFCTGLKAVFYGGNESEWAAIEFGKYGNDVLQNVLINYNQGY